MKPRTTISFEDREDREIEIDRDRGCIYKYNTNTIQLYRRLDSIRAIRVNSHLWEAFKQKARELGFSANNLINQFIASFVGCDVKQDTRTVILNIDVNLVKAEARAEAKADSKPSIKIMFLLEQVEELLHRIQDLKARAERGAEPSFIQDAARKLYNELWKAVEKLSDKDLAEKADEIKVALKLLHDLKNYRRVSHGF